MKVIQELATNRVAVPTMFEKTPSETWIHFLDPESQSHP